MSYDWQSPLPTGSRITKVGQMILRNKNVLFGLAILVPVFFVSVFAPFIATYNPTETNLGDKFADPSQEYLLGTDHLGRDLFSRVVLGGRTTIVIGLASVGVALLFGVPIGLVAGYLGGNVDEFLMRIMDVMISFPSLILALLIVTVLSSSIINVILTIGIVYTPRIARVARGSTLSVKNEEFVAAAESRGESDTYIMFGEILPNVVSPIIVEGSIRIGFAILIATSMSFLGLGTQPPTPDWGVMIAESRNYIWQTPWYLLWPSLALSTTVLGFNLLGDGIRDVLDPKTREQ